MLWLRPVILGVALASQTAAAIAAPEERVLNVFTWPDYIAPNTIADFEAEYGIKVNYDTYDSTEMAEARLLAGRTGYDVVVHAERYSARLIPIGIYRPLDRRKLTNWNNLDPWVLDALQELTRLAVMTETGERSRLMLDVAGYRERRRKELEALAADAVGEAKESQEPVPLAPMNPFERKVVHDAVAAAGLTSESEGEEPDRHVVVLPA